MKTLSVCIPTYEMSGLGDTFLEYSLNILQNQTFNDFDVVISDHSKSDLIKNVLKKYEGKLDITYIKNEENIGSSSANINNAIRHAQGKLIKILFQDDFLYSSFSLEEIVQCFDIEKDKWLVTACIHTEDAVTFFNEFYPAYTSNILLGSNTISSPSVLTIKNDQPLLFDENLIWRMDSDYYRRCFDAFGLPKVLNEINVVNRIGGHQVTNTLASEEIRRKEYDYLLKKYNL